METVPDEAQSLVVHLIGCCGVGSVEMKNGEDVNQVFNPVSTKEHQNLILFRY